MKTATESLADRRIVDAEGDIDLRVIVARLWRGRWWIIGSTILFTAALTTAAFVMTRMYRATTVLVDARTGRAPSNSLSAALGQLGDLASLAGVNVGSVGFETEESLAVLRSREFTESFIKDEQLMQELFAARWDASAGKWIGKDEEWPTLSQAFRYFNKNVRTVSQDRRTGLVTVQIEWKDPVQAAQWANDLVARLNAEMRSRAIADTNASVGYLQKELESTVTVETRQAINRLMESHINQRMLANTTLEYAFRVVDKAMPPDRTEVVRPNKLMLLALGPLVGGGVGILAVMIGGLFAPARRQS